MPDSAVVRVVREFRADLLRREEQQVRGMTRRWLEVEDSLRGSIDSLAKQLAEARAQGQTPTTSQIYRMGRYRSLLAQTEREIRLFVNDADEVITREQSAWAALGIESAVEAIGASSPKLVGTFDILPVNAVQTMAGLAGDGSPLLTLLRRAYPSAAAGMTRALIESVAIGRNPRITAREMMKGLGIALNKALVIARTEMMRAFRLAAIQEYRESGVVRGYKRMSARDNRVCAACLFLDDGRVLKLSQAFDEHPQGRCTQVPVVQGMPEVTWLSGKDWFVRQSVMTQRDILGTARYEAWRAGRITLDGMVGVRRNKVWGNSPYVKALQAK